MQTPNQGLTTASPSMQSNMSSVPMTVISSMGAPIPNVTTLNKPGGQNVVFATPNLGIGQQILSNVQILNTRPGTPTEVSQKPTAAVSSRMVIGSPQVLGTRVAPAGIPLQTLQSLQPGQQGHLLLKTENGQYQLLRVGPSPSANQQTASPLQTIRLSTVPVHSGAATLSTTSGQPVMSGQLHVPTVAPMVNTDAVGVPAAVPIQQQHQPTPSTHLKPSDNTKEKCRNFLANLLDLSSKEPPSVEINVRNLIQELIDSQVEPEEFCQRLECLLNASPQPSLIGFLKKSLPLLRQSLITRQLVIEGINPPSPIVVTSHNVVAASSLQMPHSKSTKIAVLQNIPVHTKINVNKVTSGKSTPSSSMTNFQRPDMRTSALSTVLTPGKPKDKEKKASTQFSLPQYSDDKVTGDDDINDVAAMGGVNLAEESQRILGSTDMIGTQIRSCKDEFLVPTNVMQARLKSFVLKQGLEEPSSEVANLLSHAVQERLKSLVEKLAVIAQHRTQFVTKTDSRYEVTQDVKGQLKFLEELDRVDKKRREETEREILMRAAKSRSKNEDSEQAKLKAKAKEMQRVEQEELRQREANLTALQAIGPRKKPKLDELPGVGESPSTSEPITGSRITGRSQLLLRNRIKRINTRDVIYLLEQEKETSRTDLVYKSYLK